MAATALTIFEALQAANFKEPQAKAIAHAFEQRDEQLLQQIKQQTASREETAELKAQMQHVATKADIQELRTEMQEFKSEIIRWIVAILASQAVIVLGGVAFMLFMYFQYMR